MHQPIGAGFGHPLEEFGMVGREHGAFGNEFVTICIVGATAGVHVQQPAGHAGIVYLAGFLDLELVDAALGAPIAEGFPLGGVQFVKLLGFPEWLHGSGDVFVDEVDEALPSERFGDVALAASEIFTLDTLHCKGGDDDPA